MEKIMKNKKLISGLLTLMLVTVFAMSGCKQEPEETPPGFDGSITFTDGAPTKGWSVSIIQFSDLSTTSKITVLKSAADHAVAFGTSTGVNPVGFVELPGGTFNPNGQYAVILADPDELAVKYTDAPQTFVNGKIVLGDSAFKNAN
jgi:hypothetical protein